MDLTPEEKFSAEPPEKMVPRMILEGFAREEIIATLEQLDWPTEEAAYIVDAHLAKQTGKTLPPRLPASPTTPAAITVLSALGFVGVIMSVALGLAPGLRSNTGWLLAYLLASSIIKVVCYFGMIQMRRWAVIAYAILFWAGQVPFWLSGYWNPESCIFSLGVLAAGGAYWTQMK